MCRLLRVLLVQHSVKIIIHNQIEIDIGDKHETRVLSFPLKVETPICTV